MVTPLSTRSPPLLKPRNSAVMVRVKILPVLTEPQPRMKCGGEGKQNRKERKREPVVSRGTVAFQPQRPPFPTPSPPPPRAGLPRELPQPRSPMEERQAPPPPPLALPSL